MRTMQEYSGKVNHPVEQGFVAMTGVFIDTFVVLNLTALVIITTKSIPSGKTGAELSQYAFSTLYGKGGDIFIAICMFFFALKNNFFRLVRLHNFFNAFLYTLSDIRPPRTGACY